MQGKAGHSKHQLSPGGYQAQGLAADAVKMEALQHGIAAPGERREGEQQVVLPAWHTTQVTASRWRTAPEFHGASAVQCHPCWLLQQCSSSGPLFEPLTGASPATMLWDEVLQWEQHPPTAAPHSVHSIVPFGHATTALRPGPCCLKDSRQITGGTQGSTGACSPCRLHLTVRRTRQETATAHPPSFLERMREASSSFRSSPFLNTVSVHPAGLC